MTSQVKEITPKLMTKFFIFTIFMSLYSILLFPPLRLIFLKLLGAKIGSATILMNLKFFNVHKRGFRSLKIGRKCFIGDETLIDLYGPVSLGDFVTLAQRVTIITHINVGYRNHPLQKYFPKKVSSVVIKSGAVIGTNAVILPGVIVGERSFVAAGSVVTKNVPPETLVAGVPAKVKRKIK